MGYATPWGYIYGTEGDRQRQRDLKALRQRAQRGVDAFGDPCYSIIVGDFHISDARLSQCGRFEVSPHVYGLSEDEATELDCLNNRIKGNR